VTSVQGIDHAMVSAVATTREHKDLLIIGLALIALLLKLVIAFNTFGSSDAVVFYTFAKSLSRDGLEWTYRHSILFNHPPLTAHYLQLIFFLDQKSSFQASGLTFPVLLRLPGILADFVVVLVLLEVRKSCSKILLPNWVLALFALSPVSLMVSGFHGNTDPVMVMFLVLAAYAGLKNGAFLSGLFLALSCQIKIVPLLLLPIFMFFWWERNRGGAFLLSFLLILFLLWLEPLIEFPAVFAKNVLSYGGFWGLWGITYWLRLTGFSQFSVVNFFHLPIWETVVMTGLKLFIIACIFFLAWRRRRLGHEALFASLAYAWVVFFIFTPSASAQYLVWLAPFLLLLSPVFYSWLTFTSSVFAFFFYNVTAQSFPWYFSMSTDKLNTVWTPWGTWPWATLIIGIILIWRKALAVDPSLRLFAFQALRAATRE
jgi:Gpi18-like mannosyltransferase